MHYTIKTCPCSIQFFSIVNIENFTGKKNTFVARRGGPGEAIVYPGKPQFYYIKVVFKEEHFSWTFFSDVPNHPNCKISSIPDPPNRFKSGHAFDFLLLPVRSQLEASVVQWLCHSPCKPGVAGLIPGFSSPSDGTINRGPVSI